MFSNTIQIILSFRAVVPKVGGVVRQLGGGRAMISRKKKKCKY